MWKYLNCPKPESLKRKESPSNPDKNDQVSKWKKYEEKRPARKFNESWKIGRPWLAYDSDAGKMTCTLCIDHFGVQGSNPYGNLKNVNTFVTGSSNLKSTTLTDHERCSSHIKAVAISRAKAEDPSKSQSGRALLALKGAERSRLVYLFKNAHAIAKQGRPITDYSWLCALDKAKGLDLGNTYQTEKAAVDFIFFIAGTARNKTVQLVNSANFYSFVMDGSTDISGTEQESVYLRFAKNGQLQERFLSIGAPSSTASADLYKYLNSMFERLGVRKDNLIGMGSDGASNMTGCRSGLATLLRNDNSKFINIHCLCHRLELAFRDVVKQFKIYDKLMTLLIGLHYFYKKSHKNKSGLLNAFKALNIKGILPPKVTGTRWLPHLSNGLECLTRSYAAFDAHLSTASHGNPKAEGLLKILRDFNVVAYALFLKELIEPLIQLSKKLQRKDITLADSIVWVETTYENIESLKIRQMSKLEEVIDSGLFCEVTLKGNTPQLKYRETVIDKISEALQNRFKLDDTSLSVVKTTKVLNINKWPLSDLEKLTEYGNSEIMYVADTYQDILDSRATFDKEKVLSEWCCLKLLVRRLNRDSNCLPSWSEVYEEDFSNIFLIVDLLLSLPPTSVSCETSFSQLKLVKTSRRVKLSQQTLDNLLQIKLATPAVQEYDPKEDIDNWLTASNKPHGRRRLGYERQSKKPVEPIIDLDKETTDTAAERAESESLSSGIGEQASPISDDDLSDEDDDNLLRFRADDVDSDYCSDFQDEEENNNRLLTYLKDY